MSVEIRGRAPSSDEGKRFTIEKDAWEALTYVLHQAGAAVPPEWSIRKGSGLEDAGQCSALASRLDRYLETHADERFFVDVRGKVTPPYGINVGREEIEDFIRFLRASGGFEIHPD